MSPTNSHCIAAFDFPNLSGYTQLIKEPTHKLGNCLDLLLTNAPDVVDSLVDSPLDNSHHFSISFSVKMGFKIPSITFSQKVHLKSRVDWPRVSENICNSNWIADYNSPSPVSELNKVITFLIDRRVPSKVIRRKVNECTSFNYFFIFISFLLVL